MENEKTIYKTDTVTKILRISAIAMFVVMVATFAIYIIIDPNRIFSDFAETISYCISQNPYTGVDNIHSIYPPFAFLPFYLFALICKVPLQQYIDGTMTLDVLIKQPTYLISFFLFFAICLAIVLLLTAKISKFKGEKLFWLLAIVTFFAPIVYCFWRGNNIIFAVIFVMLFFWLYDSDKKWKREIANLCLACAIAVKIYPIIICLFFIKDRRFLDMLKTILYSLVLLFLPFLLIQGGFDNIKYIWQNFTHFNSGEGRQLNFTNISLDGLVGKITELLHISVVYGILSKILRFGLVISTIVTFILAKKSEQRIQAILLSLLTYELFMGVSYFYTMAFLIIPLILYFIDFDKLSKTNKIFYGVCFAVIGCPLFANVKFALLAAIAGICMVVKCEIDLIGEFNQKRKVKQMENSKTEVSETKLEEKENDTAKITDTNEDTNKS